MLYPQNGDCIVAIDSMTSLHPTYSRRLYILCWSELSRRRLLPAVSPAAGHLTTPTVAGLPRLCETFRPTTSKSSQILRLLSSHWATSVVRTRVAGVANVGDSLRRLSALQHRMYNLLVCVRPSELPPHSQRCLRRVGSGAVSNRTRCGETNGRRPRGAWVDCSSKHTPLEWRWAPTLVKQIQGRPTGRGRGWKTHLMQKEQFSRL